MSQAYFGVADRSTHGEWVADRSESRRFSLDTGMRPVSNACSGEVGESRTARSTLIWEIPGEISRVFLASTTG